MADMVSCECGYDIKECSLRKHLLSQRHVLGIQHIQNARVVPVDNSDTESVVSSTNTDTDDVAESITEMVRRLIITDDEPTRMNRILKTIGILNVKSAVELFKE